MSTYVLMNDTFDTWHHGCRAVSHVIREEMAKRGFTLIASSRVGAHWWQDAEFVGQANESDLILINGEGSFHDASDDAAEIIKVFDKFENRKKIALINSIWQNNPMEWAEHLKHSFFVSVRDSNSQEILKSQGVSAEYCPDLSLVRIKNFRAERSRTGVVWGDGLRRSTTNSLYREYKHANGDNYYASIRPRNRSPIHPRFWKDLKFKIRCQLQNQRCFENEIDYIEFLSNRRLCITGRFHAACLSMSTHTPFLAVASNTRKISFLLEDFGLNPGRVFSSTDELMKSDFDQWDWSAEEYANLQVGLADTQKRAGKMFDTICM